MTNPEPDDANAAPTAAKWVKPELTVIPMNEAMGDVPPGPTFVCDSFAEYMAS